MDFPDAMEEADARRAVCNCDPDRGRVAATNRRAGGYAAIATAGCGAAMCEEATAFVAALDTLLRHDTACIGAPPVVLQTLHLTPFTDLGDGVMGRKPVRTGVPTSPPVARMEDYGVNPFLTYWSDIRIVDLEEISQGAVPRGACLYVFSPVTWLGEDRVRLVVVESRERPEHIAQRFVFLRRVNDRWIVTRVETGMQS